MAYIRALTLFSLLQENNKRWNGIPVLFEGPCRAGLMYVQVRHLKASEIRPGLRLGRSLREEEGGGGGVGWEEWGGRGHN